MGTPAVQRHAASEPATRGCDDGTTKRSMSAARVTGESLSFDVMRLCTCVRSEALCPKDHFVYKLNGIGASGVEIAVRSLAGSRWQSAVTRERRGWMEAVKSAFLRGQKLGDLACRPNPMAAAGPASRQDLLPTTLTSL